MFDWVLNMPLTLTNNTQCSPHTKTNQLIAFYMMETKSVKLVHWGNTCSKLTEKHLSYAQNLLKALHKRWTLQWHCLIVTLYIILMASLRVKIEYQTSLPKYKKYEKMSQTWFDLSIFTKFFIKVDWQTNGLLNLFVPILLLWKIWEPLFWGIVKQRWNQDSRENLRWKALLQ